MLAFVLASPCACALHTRAPRAEALLQGFWQGRTPAKGAPTVSAAAIMLVCETSGSPGFLQEGRIDEGLRIFTPSNPRMSSAARTGLYKSAKRGVNFHFILMQARHPPRAAH